MRPPSHASAVDIEQWLRRNGKKLIGGVDEVGRGCLFGPVVAAAVILPPGHGIAGIKDSKAVAPGRRERLAQAIKEKAIAWAVGRAEAAEIDRLNVLEASRLAMRRAVEALSMLPDVLVVDAVKLDLEIEQVALVKADANVECVAAASILAKVTRDEEMRRWDALYPGYGLGRNKGYGTAEHLRALAELGPTRQHRFSFEPVRQASRQRDGVGMCRPDGGRGRFVE